MNILFFLKVYSVTYQTKQETSSELNSELENYLKMDHKDLWHKL